MLTSGSSSAHTIIASNKKNTTKTGRHHSSTLFTSPLPQAAFLQSFEVSLMLI